MSDINNELQEFINNQDILSNDKSIFKPNSNIQSISFATYKPPVFKEKKNKLWVNNGIDNLYPNWLISITNNCPLHQAIVTNKIQNIYGEGFQVEDSQDKDMLSKQTDFLKTTNINKLLKRCISDYVMFGYFYIGIRWSNDRTKIAKIYHVDAAQVRVGIPNIETREIECFYYSEDWTQYKKKDFTPEEIPVFDPSNRIEADSIMMIRNYKSNTRFYGLPDWQPAATAIQLSYEVGQYMLSSVMNGLSPSMVINYNNGIPTEEDMKVQYQSINALYGGSAKAGKFILSYNQSNANATTITPIETSNMSEIYSRLSEFCDNSIIRAHQIPNPVLAGVAVPGQLGLSNELAQSASLYLNNVIYPIQTLFEETIQEILDFNGFTLKVFIKDNHPINFTYDDATLLNIMTVNELRNRISLPPLAKTDIPNLGVNISNADASTTPTTPTSASKPLGMSDEDAPVINSVLNSLTGRQHGGLLRIIRQVNQEKLTHQQAKVLLSSGYGLNDEQIDTFLGSDEEENMAVVPQLPKYINQLPKKKKEIN